MSMLLQCKESTKPHPEGIHSAVCVDVIDLGLVESEFQGQRRLVNKVRLFFESELKTEDGKNCIATKTFTASLHPKAKLADFLGKWRGRPVVPGESIDLAKLIGANCTLVISHQQNLVGRTYASIDAVSKPTKRLVASGGYDPVATRQRIAEWKQAVPAPNAPGGATSSGLRPPSPQGGEGNNRAGGAGLATQSGDGGQPKSGAGGASCTGHQASEPEFDPEVGF